MAGLLTKRELEVLRYAAEGYSNKHLSQTFGISEQTVKNYMSAIMKKLNARNRTHAVVLAICYGWLKVGGE